MLVWLDIGYCNGCVTVLCNGCGTELCNGCVTVFCNGCVTVLWMAVWLYSVMVVWLFNCNGCVTVLCYGRVTVLCNGCVTVLCTGCVTLLCSGWLCDCALVFWWNSSALVFPLTQFLCPRDRRLGGILFLSCLSFCHYVILSLSFCHSLWYFNLANNFWTVNARALIFHISISCDTTFPWVPLLLTLWPWPWSLTHFLKNFNLPNNFWTAMLNLWYFTWVFFVIRTFRWYHYFWPCDLDLGFWLNFWKL